MWEPCHDGVGHERHISPYIRVIREPALSHNRAGRYLYRIEYRHHKHQEWKHPESPKLYKELSRAEEAGLKLHNQIARELKGWKQ